VAQGQPFGDIGPDTSEVAGDALSNGFQCLPPTCARRRVAADELARTMIDDDKDVGVATCIYNWFDLQTA